MKVHVYLQQTQVLGEGEGCVVQTRDLVAAERPAFETKPVSFCAFPFAFFEQLDTLTAT